MEKTVCFLGHRDLWHCMGIKEKLKEVLMSLISEGYINFYDGYHGAFDELCLKTLIEIKKEHPEIKIYKVLSSYKYKDDYLPNYYAGTIYPELDLFYYKQRIIKRNEWMIDNSEIVIAHIEYNFNSGAYKGILYAQKKNKKIIFI